MKGGKVAGGLTVPADFWYTPDVADAFARTDIAQLIRLVQRTTRASQTQIGTAVGLPQPKVSEITSPHKASSTANRSVAVMRRIADGLHMPPHVAAAFLLGQAPPRPSVRAAPLTTLPPARATTVPPDPPSRIQRSLDERSTSDAASSPLTTAPTLDEIPATFGPALRHIRTQRGLSQSDLGRLVHTDKTHISKLETGHRHPPAPLVEFLDKALDAQGHLIQRADRQRPTKTEAGQQEREDEAVHRRSVLRALAAGLGIGLPSPIGDAVAELRQHLDQVLGASTISDSIIEHWHFTADGYGRAYRASPPMVFLAAIVQDATELNDLLGRPLPATQRRNLCKAATQIAGLLATTLVNLSDYREARGWFQTARRAADESQSIPLQAWVMVRHAVSALYWNDPYGALHLARNAAALTVHIPCVASAWAPAVEARAHSRLGPDHFDATRAAIARAEDAFANLDAEPQEQYAYGYTTAQLNFYRSNALTAIGDTRSAYRAQETALAHYDPNAFLDPSLIRLDRAACLLKDGEPEEAARLAVDSLRALPEEHLSPIVVQRAREFATAIPLTHHALPPVRELRATIPVEHTKPSP